MKLYMTLIFVLSALSAQAMTITEKDVVGSYKVDSEPDKKPAGLMTIEKTKKFSVSIGKKRTNGTWLVKNNELHLKAGKEECQMHYKADLTFASGAEVGNGLSCVDDKKAARVKFCHCLWEKTADE